MGSDSRESDGEALSIRLLPLDPLPSGLVRSLAAGLSRRIVAACRLAPATGEVALPELPGRDQLDAGKVLENLEALPHEARTLLVGITSSDLAIPIFTHVFGLARLGGNAALISLARLDPGYYGLPEDPERLVTRAVAEMLHEMGHLSGLQHCLHPACLMRFAADVENIDLRGGSFCSSCLQELPAGLQPRP